MMLVNLSMDIICSSKLTVFIEFHFQKTYSTLIHITFIVQNRQQKKINNEILAVKGQGIAVFWNFVLTVAFFNRNFIVVALSHPAECF